IILRPPRSTQSRSSAASDVYKRQAGKVTEEAESGENQAGFGVEARREFPGEDKRTWRGRKTGRIKPADPREASTGFGIGCHISGNGFPPTWSASGRCRGLLALAIFGPVCACSKHAIMHGS